MHNKVTYMYLKIMLVLDYVLGDFRNECLECT